jgi:hypothetical protein
MTESAELRRRSLEACIGDGAGPGPGLGPLLELRAGGWIELGARLELRIGAGVWPAPGPGLGARLDRFPSKLGARREPRVKDLIDSGVSGR